MQRRVAWTRHEDRSNSGWVIPTDRVSGGNIPTRGCHVLLGGPTDMREPPGVIGRQALWSLPELVGELPVRMTGHEEKEAGRI